MGIVTVTIVYVDWVDYESSIFIVDCRCRRLMGRGHEFSFDSLFVAFLCFFDNDQNIFRIWSDFQFPRARIILQSPFSCSPPKLKWRVGETSLNFAGMNKLSGNRNADRWHHRFQSDHSSHIPLQLCNFKKDRDARQNKRHHNNTIQCTAFEQMRLDSIPYPSNSIQFKI